jgi:hypothetical protein
MKDKYSKVIYDTLLQMKPDDSFSKMQFILTYWEDYNFFTDRSFCALLCKVKKLIPEMKFKTISGNIVRIE